MNRAGGRFIISPSWLEGYESSVVGYTTSPESAQDYTGMNDTRTSEPLPHSLRVWDNKARLSLPLGLKVWLAVLVATFLSSAVFVPDHHPARWILGGFIASHLLVIALSVSKNFTLRIGIVSLTHVACWTPGLVRAIVDVQGRGLSTSYGLWLYAIIIVVAISFLFDLKDAGNYIRHFAAGKVPPNPTREGSK